MKTTRIGVIVDFFLDKYLDTAPDLAETSVETGLVAHQVTREVVSAGAAGTVVNNLAALGVGEIKAFGAIGDDGNGYDLIRCLERQACDQSGLVRSSDWMTPTYLKPRDGTLDGLEGEHSRYDTKNRSTLPRSIEEEVLARFIAGLPDLDAVIIVDQIQEEEGATVTSRIREAIASLAEAHSKCHFLADSRFHVDGFANVIVKPNQFEAVGSHYPSPDDRVGQEHLKVAIETLLRSSGRAVVCTLGAEGALVRTPNEWTQIPASPISGPIDPTGAGDSFSAGCAASLAVGATLCEAACVGVLCAAVTAQMLSQTGTADAVAVLKESEIWRQQFE